MPNNEGSGAEPPKLEKFGNYMNKIRYVFILNFIDKFLLNPVC